MRTALRPARSLPQAVCPLSWLPGLCEGPQHGDTAPRAEGRPAVPANHTAARRMGTCGLLKSCMLCFRNQRARPTSCCSCGRGAAAPAAPNPPGLAHPAPPTHAPPPPTPRPTPRPAPPRPRRAQEACSPAPARGETEQALSRFLISSFQYFYCLCVFYDVHGILVQAVHNNSWIVIHTYGGKHATLLFISTLRVQASRC